MKATPSRKVRADTLAAAKKYTAIQGEVIYAANLLQDAFFRVFLAAIGLDRPDRLDMLIRYNDHALAIWHTVPSDSLQREMACSAISTVPVEINLTGAIKRIKWAKDRAIKLGGYRNILAHSPVTFRATPLNGRIEWLPYLGGHGTRPTHREKLDMVEGISLWNALRDDLLNLSDYVVATVKQVQRIDFEKRGARVVSVPDTWPDRPRLRSLPRLLALERKLNPQLAKKRPRRRVRR